MDVPERVARHFTQAFSLTSGGPLTKIEYYRQTTDGAEKLGTVSQESLEANGPEIVVPLVEQCSDDAASRTTNTYERYAFVFYRGSDDFESQIGFQIRSPGRASGIGGSGENATPAAFASMALKSMTENNRTMQVFSESTTAQLAKQLLESERRREQLESRMVDHFGLVQNLLDRQTSRDIALAQAKQAAVRNDRLFAGLSALVPLIAGQLFERRGNAGLTAARSLRDHAVGQLIAGFSQEQLSRLVTILQPEQAVALVELMQSFAREQAREREATPEVLREPEVTS